MPKVKQVKVKELSELPLFLTIENIVDLIGFSRPVVDKWFKEKDFPVISTGVFKVCKYEFMDWLRSKYAPYSKAISYSNMQQILEKINLAKKELEVN